MKTLKHFVSFFLATFVILVLPCTLVSGQTQEDVFDRVAWQKGPGVANLGDIAKIDIPNECLFADAKDTRLLMEAMQNPPSGAERGFIMCRNSGWFALFEFSETGYIRDDEKHSLDADKILQALKKGNDRVNEERKKRGWAEVYLVGWERPPYYDLQTHNLEWATKVRSDEGFAVNHNTRLLGRMGVMSATLVTDPKTFANDLPEFKSLLKGFAYKGGNRYEEFVKGDKIATYGLTGLIVGGAAAAAAKTGLLKYLWKILVAVGIGAAAFLRKLFKRKPSL